jgi:PAS domain S-box-containing protein
MNLINHSWRKVKKHWKCLPIETRGSMAITIPLMCLLGAVVVDTLLRQRIIEAQIQVDRTNQVLVKSQGILISLLNAETSVRSYYIGKQSIFLTPYNEALTMLEPTLISLEQLIQDNPSQVQRVNQLKQLAHDQIILLQGTIQQVETKAGGSPASIAQYLTKGKKAMDKFRDAIETIEAEEYRLLAICTQSLRAQQALNAYAVWYGIGIGLFGTAINVRFLRQLATELHERETRLRDSRNLNEAIMDNIVDAVMVINVQDQVETFNDAAVKMFDYTPSEVIGQPWQKLLAQAPDGKDLAVENIWQTMGQRKNDEWFPIEASINNIILDDDQIIIIRDITDRQQAAAKLAAKAFELAALNASLQASNESLSQSNHELDQFAYIASHDLKAPLRGIASLAEWIEEDLDGSVSTEARSYLGLLRRRVDRMQGLLNSLLEYSRAGRKRAPMEIVNVEHLLTEVIQALAPPETFTISIVSPMPTISTRLQPLRQVFSHLIDNAIRHHPTKSGIIEISVIDQGDQHEFSISDNGNGIDIQFQKRIYKIFQTLEARDRQENIGAGLAIIKKIVMAEGGIVRLKSSAGNGASFRFTWLKQPIIRDSLISLPEL